MSESEDEAAFRSADEDVETSQPAASGNKKAAAKTVDNKESEEKDSVVEKEKSAMNNMNSKKQKKKKKPTAKARDELKEVSTEEARADLNAVLKPKEVQKEVLNVGTNEDPTTEVRTVLNAEPKKATKMELKEGHNEEEFAAEILSFESSDSVVSTEISPVQLDNMNSSKPDLEEIRITDESDEGGNWPPSRINVFDDVDSPPSPKEPASSEMPTDTQEEKMASLKIDDPLAESLEQTCSDPQNCDQQLEKPAAPKGSSWGWSNWGSSIIGAAASSVSTFTTQLGDGVNTIIDTVESGLSVVPNPEELAREAKENENMNLPPEKDSATDALIDEEVTTGEMATESSANPGGWWSGWGGGVSKITGAVQERSKNLVTGSLDVLESIGRKTFDAINDHDRTGLREKTKVLFERGESPQLADLLKEAKQKTETQEKIAQEHEEALKSDFAALFEDYQGQAHMDALQLLSQQSEAKLSLILESLSPDSEKETQVRSQLLALKDAFQVAIEDEDDLDKDHLFGGLVTDHLSEVHLGTQPEKLNMCQASTRKWIAEFIQVHSEEKDEDSDEGTKQPNAKDIYTTAIQSIAELTSKIMEQFHKSGELILLQQDLDKDMEDRAKSLASLTKIFWTEINILSTKFAKCLNIVEEKAEEEKAVNQYITNVYLEASNSSSYIDDGFRSLLPIMQLALLEKNFNE